MSQCLIYLTMSPCTLALISIPLWFAPASVSATFAVTAASTVQAPAASPLQWIQLLSTAEQLSPRHYHNPCPSLPRSGASLSSFLLFSLHFSLFFFMMFSTINFCFVMTSTLPPLQARHLLCIFRSAKQSLKPHIINKRSYYRSPEIVLLMGVKDDGVQKCNRS